MSLDWDEINSKLPFEKTEGVRDVIGHKELFNCKPAINRAFHYSKNRTEGGEHGYDYIEFSEFRLFLQSLRMFFEFYQAFDRIDEGQDSKICKDEFVNAKDTLEKWVGEIEDLEAEFDSIDVNEGGEILFTEFVEWAMAKDLNIEVEELKWTELEDD